MSNCRTGGGLMRLQIASLPFLAANALAQSSTARLSGTVRDSWRGDSAGVGARDQCRDGHRQRMEPIAPPMLAQLPRASNPNRRQLQQAKRGRGGRGPISVTKDVHIALNRARRSPPARPQPAEAPTSPLDGCGANGPRGVPYSAAPPRRTLQILPPSRRNRRRLAEQVLPLIQARWGPPFPGSAGHLSCRASLLSLPVRHPAAQSMHRHLVAVCLQCSQQPPHLPLAHSQLLAGKCQSSLFHPASLTPSSGHFYLALIGHSHVAHPTLAE